MVKLVALFGLAVLLATVAYAQEDFTEDLELDSVDFPLFDDVPTEEPEVDVQMQGANKGGPTCDPATVALRMILGHEGGCQNMKGDRGNWLSGERNKGCLGYTCMGVIPSVAWDSRKLFPANLQAACTDACTFVKCAYDLDRDAFEVGARAIYEKQYFGAGGCSSLGMPAYYVCADIAVNSGPGRSRQFLRDSKCSGMTTDIAKGTCINQLHREFYRKIGTGDNERFLDGWLRRASDRDVFILSKDYCYTDTSCAARGGTCAEGPCDGTRLSGRVCNGDTCCPGRKYCCVPDAAKKGSAVATLLQQRSPRPAQHGRAVEDDEDLQVNMISETSNGPTTCDPASVSLRMILGHEGGCQNMNNDVGNWISGKRGVGCLGYTCMGVIPGVAWDNRMLFSKEIRDACTDKCTFVKCAYDFNMEDYEAGARMIFKKRYVDAGGCSKLQMPAYYVCTDISVNSGPGRSRQFLRDPTCSAHTDPKALATCINQMHREFYQKIGVGKNSQFLAGWLRRASDRDAFILSEDYCYTDTSCSARGGVCKSTKCDGTKVTGKVCNGHYCCGKGSDTCCVDNRETFLQSLKLEPKPIAPMPVGPLRTPPKVLPLRMSPMLSHPRTDSVAAPSHDSVIAPPPDDTFVPGSDGPIVPPSEAKANGQRDRDAIRANAQQTRDDTRKAAKETRQTARKAAAEVQSEVKQSAESVEAETRQAAHRSRKVAREAGRATAEEVKETAKEQRAQTRRAEEQLAETSKRNAKASRREAKRAEEEVKKLDDQRKAKRLRDLERREAERVTKAEESVKAQITRQGDRDRIAKVEETQENQRKRVEKDIERRAKTEREEAEFAELRRVEREGQKELEEAAKAQSLRRKMREAADIQGNQRRAMEKTEAEIRRNADEAAERRRTERVEEKVQKDVRNLAKEKENAEKLQKAIAGAAEASRRGEREMKKEIEGKVNRVEEKKEARSQAERAKKLIREEQSEKAKDARAQRLSKIVREGMQQQRDLTRKEATRVEDATKKAEAAKAEVKRLQNLEKVTKEANKEQIAAAKRAAKKAISEMKKAKREERARKRVQRVEEKIKQAAEADRAAAARLKEQTRQGERRAAEERERNAKKAEETLEESAERLRAARERGEERLNSKLAKVAEKAATS